MSAIITDQRKYCSESLGIAALHTTLGEFFISSLPPNYHAPSKSRSRNNTIKSNDQKLLPLCKQQRPIHLQYRQIIN